jgi:hypothetical protein
VHLSHFKTVKLTDLPTPYYKQGVFNQWYKKSAGALRLLGFGTAGLSSAGTGQKLLFSDPEEEKQMKIDDVYDKIRGKFGDDSLKRGE